MQKSILVDFDAFEIRISEYDKVIRTIADFSIGRDGHRTSWPYDGQLSLTLRERDHVSTKYPPPKGGAHMPYSLFFDDNSGCAFHAGDTAVPSHGCIHLQAHDAQWLYLWAGSSPVGLKITGGQYPAPVRSARLYRMGAANMQLDTIRAIQAKLNEAGCLADQPDGQFGVNTDAAVRTFQERHQLVVDGVVGPDTAEALGLVF